MLKIAVCDDNLSELDRAYNFIKKYFNDRSELDGYVKKFESALDLLDQIEAHGNFDIYFLDILMPEMSGIDLGTEIRKKDNDSKIIILTSSNEYGIDSYKITANDYLLKPCREKDIYLALDKVVYSMNRELSRRFIVNIQGGVHSVPYSKLLYLEYYKHKLVVYTVSGEKIESVTLRESFASLIAPLLEDKRFMQISASYLINMQYVNKFTSHSFELSNGKILPLSRKYADARSAYLDYIFEKSN